MAICLTDVNATTGSNGAGPETTGKTVTLEDQCKTEQKQVDDFNKQCLASQDRICAVIRNKTSSPCVVLMKQKTGQATKAR